MVTNLPWYLNFAFTNVVYLLANAWSGNTNRIVETINRDYPCLNLLVPGPNTARLYVYKDGFFLVYRVPFPELISTAFKINEGMAAQIAMRIETMPVNETFAILGMTFKANNDDVRNSLSFKLKKQVENGFYDVVCVDPYVERYSNFSVLAGADCIILMTARAECKDLAEIALEAANPDRHVLDIWGFWDAMRFTSANGVFRLGDAMVVDAGSDSGRGVATLTAETPIDAGRAQILE